MAGLLIDLWSRFPDLRLGQLMTALAENMDVFYIEDDVVEKRLMRWLDDLNKGREEELAERLK